jgi:hypothetical protein
MPHPPTLFVVRRADAIDEVNALLRRAQVARELGSVLHERHLEPLPAADLLAVTRPVHAAIGLGGVVEASRVPRAVLSGALRRFAGPPSIVARRARSSPRVELLTAVDREATEPRPAVPNGMVAGAVPWSPNVDVRPALSAEALRSRVLARLSPAITVEARVRARVEAPADTWTRPDPLAEVVSGVLRWSGFVVARPVLVVVHLWSRATWWAP